MERAHIAKLETGDADRTPGLLEQWLEEGKLSREQAIIEAANMFWAGVDSVCFKPVARVPAVNTLNLYVAYVL